MAIASTREIASAGARPSRTLLATAGHRLALERIRFVAGDAGSQIEVDSLHLSEVDAEGRVVAVVIFDPDDRRAASAEMLDRYARSEAARGIPAALFDALRALNAHDLGRLRTLLPDDFVMHDRRRTGLGRLERADDYLASLAALIAESPDVATEILYVVAVEKHGMLVLARNFGTLRDGGEFESVYGRIGLVRNDRLVGGEMFEPEDIPAARVRFAAMRGNGEQGELRP